MTYDHKHEYTVKDVTEYTVEGVPEATAKEKDVQEMIKDLPHAIGDFLKIKKPPKGEKTGDELDDLE